MIKIKLQSQMEVRLRDHFLQAIFSHFESVQILGHLIPKNKGETGLQSLKVAIRNDLNSETNLMFYYTPLRSRW